MTKDSICTRECLVQFSFTLCYSISFKRKKTEQKRTPTKKRHRNFEMEVTVATFPSLGDQIFTSCPRLIFKHHGSVLN